MISKSLVAAKALPTGQTSWHLIFVNRVVCRSPFMLRRPKLTLLLILGDGFLLPSLIKMSPLSSHVRAS